MLRRVLFLAFGAQKWRAEPFESDVHEDRSIVRAEQNIPPKAGETAAFILPVLSRTMFITSYVMAYMLQG